MDIKKLEQMGMEQGFSHVALLDCDTIELKQEVRQMCARIPVISMESAGAVRRGVERLRNVRRECGSISMELSFRLWVNWRMLWMVRA